ncbi:hypothetical protein Csa_002260 [Cucumis sativus]|nr:hypothetical protein Csa_002260 [Cucumis sativus]
MFTAFLIHFASCGTVSLESKAIGESYHSVPWNVGPEKHGRVLGYGVGVTPSEFGSSSKAR